MLTKTHFSQGLRYFLRSTLRKLKGPKRFSGSASEICRKVVDSCWNGVYFRNSIGHYGEFWARDFGFCTDALLKLGYRKEVLATLDYALGVYSRNKGICAAITPDGRPFSFPNHYSIDSVAYVFRSLRLAKAGFLLEKYSDFLQREADRFCRTVLDDDGLVRSDTRFSAMRDYALRKSSCYDNTMVAMLAKELKLLGIKTPLDFFNFKKLLKQNFWTGTYFLDDLSGARRITGDANLFPFWLGVFDSKKMLKSAFRAVQDCGLDRPFPLKYASAGSRERMIALEFLVRGWERNCIWAHMGPLYIALLRRIDRPSAEKHIKRYCSLVEEHGTFYELYAPDGRPYKSVFYHADEGMLWAANLLVLVEK